MVNHDGVTVRKFMLCTWPQIIMERLFLHLIKKKNQSRQVLSTELPQNIEFPLFVPLLKFQNPLPPPLTWPVRNPDSPPPSPPFTKEGEETMIFEPCFQWKALLLDEN